MTIVIPEDIVPSVTAFMGQSALDTRFQAQAVEIVATIAHMVHEYTRGNGFDEAGVPTDGIKRVIISASARLLANPEQIQFQTGIVVLRGAFEGWTALERTILNSYRKVAQA